MRQLRAILALPFVAAVVVPAAIVSLAGRPGSPPALQAAAGSVSLLCGLLLFAWTVRLFATRGEGTLAPWDPPRKLVVAGPYRYCRNPMLTGVIAVLLGQAALFASLPLLAWAVLFWIANTAWFMVYEEPGLERRFGEDYRRYKAAVPRWIPRLVPWDQ